MFEIDGQQIGPGEAKTISLSLARLYDYTELTMPIRVIRGKTNGPTIFVSAAIHGDEIIGSEIVRRLLVDRRLKQMRGTLVAIPIVNVFGYNSRSRYLPDRRDLNRCFPGSPTGSLTSRIAHIFFESVIKKCDFGIDLHSGAIHRNNLPQIRANLDNPKTKDLAMAFGAPVVLNSPLRDGSLREAAEDAGVSVLVFEGGEALRYDERVIRSGLQGVLTVMSHVGMVTGFDSRFSSIASFLAKSSYWVRASQSGSLRNWKKLGARVEEGDRLGTISDALGKNKVHVKAPRAGIIIGRSMIPLVNRGDALFHIATFEDAETVYEYLEQFDEAYFEGDG